MRVTTAHGKSSLGARLRLGPAGDGFDSAIAGRVRLYLQVTFLINAFFAAVAFITALGGIAGGEIQVRNLTLIGVTTMINGSAWFLVTRGRHRGIGSPLVASVTTIMLAAVYTHAAMNNPGDPNPTRTGFFALLIVTIVLVLRSSLIPSPAIATLVVGTLSVAGPIYASRVYAMGEDRLFFIWMIGGGIVVVAVTAVTSATVYGLERKRQAAAQLGQYQIERLLGRGGMGEVYLAKHALLQRPTAIKLLRDVSTSSARDLFRQEVQTASGLTHPNTVEIYDYGRTPEGVFYFAMEFVEGATLEDVVTASGAMPVSRVVHVLRQAAGALREAHARGLVHRDIKPSNLMLCERGGIFDTLKVMDFGLAVDLTRANGQGEGGLTGTPLYLAPEMILEENGAVAQSDIYALGATAFFLLTGAPPFSSGDLVDVLGDHLATDPPSLDVDDDELASLVMRCLSKEPRDRPEDAGVLALELEACPSFAQWDERDAAIWWAEHQEVVAARAGESMDATDTERARSTQRS